MKKFKKWFIALMVVAGLFDSFFYFLFAMSIYAYTDIDYSDPSEDMAVWMSYIEDDTLLKNVVIPGAHDAATKSMIYLAKTQGRSIEDLLLCGTRYLDIRVGQKNDKLRIYHGPIYGSDYEPVLKDVYYFISSHPTETIILDLQHFDNGAKNVALALTVSYLYEFFVTNDTDKSDLEFIDTLPLSACRGKVLLLLGEEEGESEECNYIFKRNNDAGTIEDAVIRSDYVEEYNGSSSVDYVENCLPIYIDNYARHPVGLFVLQGQLTDLWYFRGMRFRERAHYARMDAFTANLATSPDLQFINIIIRDFNGPKKNAIILKLNLAKNVVNQQNVAAFTAMCG